jgi:AcrR family transcriptional regulator
VSNDAMDPRAVRSRDAMLRAAREILQREGPGAVTHQRVAREAGVGRATVYRHWARPEQLLLEAMGPLEMPFFRDPRPPVRPWLRVQLRRLADELAVPAIVAISATLMQGALLDPGVAERRDASVGTLTRQLSDVLDLAVSTGELTGAAAAHDAVAMLVGTLQYRVMMQVDEVPDALIDRLLDGLGTWDDTRSALVVDEHPATRPSSTPRRTHG